MRCFRRQWRRLRRRLFGPPSLHPAMRSNEELDEIILRLGGHE